MSIFDTIEQASAQKLEDKEQPVKKTNTYGQEDKVYLAKDIDVDGLKRGTKRFGVVSDNGKDIPEDVKKLITDIAMTLGMKQYVLRASASNRNPLEQVIFPIYAFKEIFLPFRAVNKSVSTEHTKPTDAAFSAAAWLYCKIIGEYAKDKDGKPMEAIDKFNAYNYKFKAFKAVNMHLYLGEKLNEPVEFMIVWSKCGTNKITRDTNYDELGFEVPRVIKDCRRLDIPVYNLGNEEDVNTLLEDIKQEAKD